VAGSEVVVVVAVVVVASNYYRGYGYNNPSNQKSHSNTRKEDMEYCEHKCFVAELDSTTHSAVVFVVAEEDRS
jgi:hypothetical protein